MSGRVGSEVAGRYLLRERLGVGGMGVVWRAYDQMLDREVAVKELLAGGKVDDRAASGQRQRVLREARAAAGLSHPSVVAVFDVVEDEGFPWIVMEFVAARSIQDTLDAGGRLPLDRLADVGRQVAEALEHAHSRGIVHRDVKPGNVLVAADGVAKLTDFGIARREGDVRLTATGTTIGSPAYMSPEQIEGRELTGASDVWSLGATLFAAIEGRSPFERTDPMASLAAVIRRDLPPSSNAGSLGGLLMAMMHLDPGQRPTARQVADALTGNGPVSQPPTPGGTSVAPTLQLLTGAFDAHAAASYAQASERRGSRSWKMPAVLVATAVLIVVAVVVTIVMVPRGSSHHSLTSAQTVPSSSGPTGPAASATHASSAAPVTSSAASAVPSGFRPYQDGTGFSLAVPADWTGPTRQGSSVFFHSPDGSALLQIDQTSTPGPSAIQDWRDQEPGISQARPDYQLIKIAPTGDQLPVPDDSGTKAADWEYTYSTPTGTRHVLDRGFTTNTHGYAILIAAPDTQWNATLQNLQPAFTSFHPATP